MGLRTGTEHKHGKPKLVPTDSSRKRFGYVFLLLDSTSSPRDGPRNVLSGFIRKSPKRNQTEPDGTGCREKVNKSGKAPAICWSILPFASAARKKKKKHMSSSDRFRLKPRRGNNPCSQAYGSIWVCLLRGRPSLAGFKERSERKPPLAGASPEKRTPIETKLLFQGVSYP